MVMSFIFLGILGISILISFFSGTGSAVAAAIPEGAQAGITLVLSLAGPICLWTGVGKLIEKVGFTQALSKVLSPLLFKIFPDTKKDKVLANHLSSNICANFLGLGNAATPMGILAAQQLARRSKNGVANDQLCRLVVLNTASIQLIPATVAAVRSGLGCHSPFDILPAVWITSFVSAGLGLLAAWFLGRMWKK